MDTNPSTETEEHVTNDLFWTSLTRNLAEKREADVAVFTVPTLIPCRRVAAGDVYVTTTFADDLTVISETMMTFTGPVAASSHLSAVAELKEWTIVKSIVVARIAELATPLREASPDSTRQRKDISDLARSVVSAISSVAKGAQ